MDQLKPSKDGALSTTNGSNLKIRLTHLMLSLDGEHLPTNGSLLIIERDSWKCILIGVILLLSGNSKINLRAWMFMGGGVLLHKNIWHLKSDKGRFKYTLDGVL